jgi:hypothetical protein
MSKKKINANQVIEILLLVPPIINGIKSIIDALRKKKKK